jgi:adenylosuccinate synthase
MPLILSLHRELDGMRESAATQTGTKIGTTGRGIGPAYEDKVGRRAIRVMDLEESADVAGQDRAPACPSQCAAPRSWKPRKSRPQAVLDELLASRRQSHALHRPVWQVLDTHRAKGARILFEGAQGIMLDIDLAPIRL